MSKSKSYVSFLRWTIWSLAIVFFLYEFAIRVLPTAATNEIMEHFNIHASSLGVMISFYLYAYAPMQLVSGLLLDRFGARICLTVSCFICAIGCWIFADASTILSGSIARAFMGLGSASAFVGLIYLSSHWFEPSKLPWLIGLGNSLGMLGAAIGGGPFSYLIEKFGFRNVNLYLAYAGLVVCVLLILIIRDDPPKANAYNPPKNKSSIRRSLKMALSNKFLWINSLAALFYYAPTVAFGGLWAAPFVTSAYGVSPSTGALASSIFYLGWVFGGPVFGRIALTTEQCSRDVIIGSLIGALCLICLIYIPLPSVIWAFFWLFVAGFFCSAQLLHYSIAVELCPISIKATASSFTNLVVFIGGSLIMPLVGLILDYFWSGAFIGTLRQYSVKDFQIALAVFPIGLLISALISWIGLYKTGEA
jgi:sugar phosphate permease